MLRKAGEVIPGLNVNVFKKHGIPPIYVPRQDMPARARQMFNEGLDTDMIASLFGLKESAVERWLHKTCRPIGISKLDTGAG